MPRDDDEDDLDLEDDDLEDREPIKYDFFVLRVADDPTIEATVREQLKDRSFDLYLHDGSSETESCVRQIRSLLSDHSVTQMSFAAWGLPESGPSELLVVAAKLAMQETAQYLEHNPVFGAGDSEMVSVLVVVRTPYISLGRMAEIKLEPGQMAELNLTIDEFGFSSYSATWSR